MRDLCIWVLLQAWLSLPLSWSHCWSAAQSSPLPISPNLYAVIVGVSQYKDNRFNLKMAARDAAEVEAFFKERRRLFSDFRVIVLTDERATRAKVAQALRSGLADAGKEDIAIIYLAGHGSEHPKAAGEYYFWPYDVDPDNLFGTAILMNDPNLFKTIRSENVLLIADSCTSGGYLSGLRAGKDFATAASFNKFSRVSGRFGISSCGPQEIASELPKFGAGLFTFFLLKGLRGGAEADRRGIITVKNLFDYASQHTRQESSGRQNPQLYCEKGAEATAPVFPVPVYRRGLHIDVKFFYEDEQQRVRLLTPDTELKSGQRVGVAFKADQDCYAHLSCGGILLDKWDDSFQIPSSPAVTVSLLAAKSTGSRREKEGAGTCSTTTRGTRQFILWREESAIRSWRISTTS